MSLAIGASCLDGVIVLTDSAATVEAQDGPYEARLISKTWSVGLGSVRIAACGRFRAPASSSPDFWPQPSTSRWVDIGYNRFEALALALEEQLASGEVTAGTDHYHALVAGGEPESFPKLARITKDGIEWAAPGALALAGYARPVNIQVAVPAMLADCQDLLVVIAARTIAANREQPLPPDVAGPTLSWPLRIATWRYGPKAAANGWWTDIADTVVEANSLEAIERRWWAHSVVEQASPRLRAGLIDGNVPSGSPVSFETQILSSPRSEQAKGDR